jgi:hypothetical protein
MKFTNIIFPETNSNSESNLDIFCLLVPPLFDQHILIKISSHSDFLLTQNLNKNFFAAAAAEYAKKAKSNFNFLKEA